MGRLSQAFWALNAETWPDEREKQFYYTSLSLNFSLSEYLKKLRREIRKEKRNEVH